MNNILDFFEYKIQARLYEESLVASQILEPLDESIRGKIRKKINQKAEIFVREALRDEIEMGAKLNEVIQNSVDELKERIDKIQEFVDKTSPKKTKLFKDLEKIFEEIRKSSFELLEILSGVKINFADYVQNATMATFVNFGVLFIPTRSIFLLKKSYKYFIGIIKNTIRRDLLMLMLNFDQFENTVLIQSLIAVMLGEKSKRGQSYEKLMKDAERASKIVKQKFDMELKSLDRKAPAIGFDTRYDNTYTKTLDQLKSFVLEDDSKYLEAIKAGMRTQALDEVDTKSYVELLISAAEECAYEVSNAIHTNFIDKVSVFKLANQKQLIELVKKDKELFDKERIEEDKKREEELRKHEDEELERMINEEGPKIFKKVVTDNSGNPDKQVEEFENLDDIEIDDKRYDKKSILSSWLSLYDKDSHSFKNWEDNKDEITDLLKLYFNEAPVNDESYTKYSNILVDCLLPCACENIRVIKRIKDKEFEDDYDDDKDDDEKIEKITLKNAFSILALRKADSREKRLLDSIYEDTSISEKRETMEVDKKKKKLWETALKLISDNLVKLESDVILEVIEGMYNEDDMTYKMSSRIMKDVVSQLEKLKEIKNNDYDTSVNENKEDKK